MRNQGLAADHVHRASVRLQALNVLFEARSWADVVRESAEVVELALKGLVRSMGIDPPRIHDMADVLLAEEARLPPALSGDVHRLAEASRNLRRDRELAFYGAEDLTPSDFYKRRDAEQARQAARLVVRLVRPHVPKTA